MKYLKMLVLAAVTAIALMAFAGAGPASAAETFICKNAACTERYGAGTEVNASLTGGTAILETTAGVVLDTCTGAAMVVHTNTEGGEPLKGNIETLSWANCTRPTVTLNKGVLSIAHVEGTNDGQIYAEGTRVTVNTVFGSCVYGPVGEKLHLGLLDGGAEAQIAINKIIPLVEGGGCPMEARWTATYKVTSPKPLHVGT